MNLRPCLLKALGFALAAAFLLIGTLLLSMRAALLIIFNAVSMLIQLLGVMIVLNIKLSAIPAVILVASVGIGVCFSVHVSLVSFRKFYNTTEPNWWLARLLRSSAYHKLILLLTLWSLLEENTLLA